MTTNIFNSLSARSNTRFSLSLLVCATIILVTHARAAAAGTNDPFARMEIGLAINDQEIEHRLRLAGEHLLAQRNHVTMKTLAGQLQRHSCKLTLPKTQEKKTLRPVELVEHSRQGVLVVTSLYQCGSCGKWHVASASGFVLTESGVFATCYHVVNQPDHAVMVVMTGGGRFCSVREVLAADEEHDVALVQLDGTGFAALSVSTEAPVGSAVYVVSHPEEQYFTVTQGLVARYFTGQEETGEAVMMSITADFGPGSSGCPVLNDQGCVVGMADNIVSTTTATKEGKVRPGLLFKHARPAQAILNLIQPPRRSSRGRQAQSLFTEP